MKTRCGNKEEENKYWVEESKRKCVFCGSGQDNLVHYVRGREEVNDWFKELGSSERKRVRRIRDDTLDNKKGKTLLKLWREKERKKGTQRGTQ